MGILTGILSSLAVLTSLFMICLILIQRGKGGGLAGAFGGMGGSSAFGTKAGDVFTRVTMCVAGFWIFLCMVMVILSNRGADSAWGSDTAPPTSKVTRESAAKPGSKSGKASSSKTTSPAASSTPAPAANPASPVDAPAIPAAPSGK